MPFSSRNGVRVTALDAFLSEADRPPNLTVFADSQVATVVLDRGRAAGVRLLDDTEIRAEQVILTAGVYGSPAILLRSGIGPEAQLSAAGIDVAVQLPGVGANLADHASVSVDSGWHGTAHPAHILHTLATFRSSRRAADAAPDLAIWISDPEGDEAEFSFDVLLMKPESRGSLRIASADPAVPPRISLPGVGTSADARCLAEAYGIGLQLANDRHVRALAGGKGPRDVGGATRRRAMAEMYYSIPHTIGTCRMGPPPSMATLWTVVAWCTVWRGCTSSTPRSSRTHRRAFPTS
jgi:choline dehydrogenase-like flavoprotein